MSRKIAVALAACLLSTAAWSQEINPAMKPQYDQAFKSMLEAPSDLDRMFTFAGIAAQAGDLEGAIGTLERMLIFNPNLPRIKLELGALYSRLGSYDVAQAYLQEALATPNLPPEVQAKATALMEEVKSQGQVFSFKGQLVAGLKGQTNANAGPVGSRVKLFDFDLTLAGNGKKRSDFSAFTVLGGTATYDIGSQFNTALEANGTAYISRQFELAELSVTAFEVDAGPRFYFDPANKDAGSIRPFFVANHISVGDVPYSMSFGVGMEGSLALSPSWTLDARTEVRNINYRSSATRATVDERDGVQFRATGGLTWLITPEDRVRVGGTVNRINARQAWEEYGEVGLEASYSKAFTGPLKFWSDQPWIATLSGSVNHKTYDIIDGLVSLTTLRRDEELMGSGTMIVPILDNLSGIADVRYTKVGSTLPNYRYRDLALTLSAAYRF